MALTGIEQRHIKQTIDNALTIRNLVERLDESDYFYHRANGLQSTIDVDAEAYTQMPEIEGLTKQDLDDVEYAFAIIRDAIRNTNFNQMRLFAGATK